MTNVEIWRIGLELRCCESDFPEATYLLLSEKKTKTGWKPRGYESGLLVWSDETQQYLPVLESGCPSSQGETGFELFSELYSGLPGSESMAFLYEKCEEDYPSCEPGFIVSPDGQDCIPDDFDGPIQLNGDGSPSPEVKIRYRYQAFGSLDIAEVWDAANNACELVDFNPNTPEKAEGPVLWKTRTGFVSYNGVSYTYPIDGIPMPTVGGNDLSEDCHPWDENVNPVCSICDFYHDERKLEVWLQWPGSNSRWVFGNESYGQNLAHSSVSTFVRGVGYSGFRLSSIWYDSNGNEIFSQPIYASPGAPQIDYDGQGPCRLFIYPTLEIGFSIPYQVYREFPNGQRQEVIRSEIEIPAISIPLPRIVVPYIEGIPPTLSQYALGLTGDALSLIIEDVAALTLTALFPGVGYMISQFATVTVAFDSEVIC